MNIINLTPHEVVVKLPEGDYPTFRSFPPSGNVARVVVTSIPDGRMSGMDVVRTEYGSVENLPEPQPETVYIVSVLVLGALSGSRPDCVAPDTGPTSAIRNPDGTIRAVRRFTR